jgi:predicted RNase H-like nuclease
LPGLKRALKRFNLQGNWSRPGVTKDELDALTCALVAREELRGNAMAIGDPEEGLMILPRGKGRIQESEFRIQKKKI